LSPATAVGTGRENGVKTLQRQTLIAQTMQCQLW
jgi:hypothetical protein